MAIIDETSRESKKSARRGINGVLVLILVLLLGGVILYLLSVINSQRYFLLVKEGQLVVEQGLFLPIGSKAFQPTDGALLEQYAPLNIPAGEVLPEKSTYSNLGELDRRLFGLLSVWAKKNLNSKDPKAFDAAIHYVDRARRLSGLTDEQQRELSAIRAELAYMEGERLVRGAFNELAKALKSFKLASELGGARHDEAEKWVYELDKRLDAYRRLGANHDAAATMSIMALPESLVAKDKVEAAKQGGDTASDVVTAAPAASETAVAPHEDGALSAPKEAESSPEALSQEVPEAAAENLPPQAALPAENVAPKPAPETQPIPPAEELPRTPGSL